MRILVIEDSPRVGDTLNATLRARGHLVVLAVSVQAADQSIDAQSFDLAIVDVGLPEGSGLDWCRAARKSGQHLPMLVLTARDQVADRVAGLEAGADDYMGKPFSVDELAARVTALGRRGPRWTESVRQYGALVVDRDRRIATIDGARVAFTAREFDIVALIAWRDGRVVSRTELLESIWGDASDGAAGSFEVLLGRIRRKFSERGLRAVLRTVRQVGYAWSLERSKPG